MNKQIFIAKLRSKLCGLPRRDIDERVSFYSEMIDDRIEDGLSEREAVMEIGSVDLIAEQIKKEAAAVKAAKRDGKTKRSLGSGQILLLILGSPIWLSLIIAAGAVCFSLYASAWAVVVSLWAAFASVVIASFGGVILSIVNVFLGNALTGAAVFSASLVCFGLSIFFFYGCKAISNGLIQLTKKILAGKKSGKGGRAL